MSYFGLIRGFRSSDSTAQPLRLDKSTNTIQTIDYPHHEIHAGSHFFLSKNKDVANGGTFNLAFTTAASTTYGYAHMLFGLVSELECEIAIYEGITSYTGGTSETPLNNNRNSINASNLITTVESDTTATVGSPTTLFQLVYGSGKNFGGNSRSESEIILKESTKYYIVVTNQATGSSNEVNLTLDWYEHKDIA